MFTHRFSMLVLCLVYTLPLRAGESDAWVLAKEVDGITLYTKVVADAPVTAVKTVMEVEGTTSGVAALIMDAAATPEWIYGVESTEIVKSDGPDEVWVRNLIAMPWPIADRDNVNQLQRSQLSQGDSVIIEMTNRPESRALESGVIRMPVAEGSWLLTSRAGGRVEITHEYMADPGGKLPDWLLNLFILEGPIKTFQAMRGMLQKPDYRDVSL